MSHDDRIQERLTELGQAAAPGPSIADDVMSRIATEPRPARASVMRSWIMKSKLSRAAAAVLVVAGVAALAMWLGAGGIALADVEEIVEKAETVCLTLTFQDGEGSTNTFNLMYMAPGITRYETESQVIIIDWEKGKLLVLYPVDKWAHLASVEGMEKHFGRNWLADLKKIVGGDSAERLDDKKIDGRTVAGWRVTAKGESATVWADAKTAEMVEVVFESDEGQAVMSNFEFGRKLDKSKFVLKAPEGYRTTPPAKYKEADVVLKDVVALMEIWARGADGEFPRSLMDQADWGRASAAAFKNIKITKEEHQAINSQISRAFWFVYGRGGWKYVGKGVKVGDKETAIFIYKPKDAENYLVVYGDLSIKEVAEKDLPEPPASAPAPE